MLDENTKLNFVLSQFDELESLLADCLSFIPFIDENKCVISPKFAPIIVESCGLIESLFKEYAGKREKKRGMKEYSKVIEPCLSLEETITIFLNPPVMFLSPFIRWTSKPPAWWLAYNKLKHDRLSSYDASTYDAVVQSLAGLHQVISRDVDFVPSLLSAGWFNSESPDVGELVAARIASAGTPMQVIPVESRFFVTPLHQNFVTYENGRPVVEGCDFTNKVKDLLTVYEWF